VIFDKESML